MGIGLKPEREFILFKSLKLEKKIKQYYFDITNYEKLNSIIEKKNLILFFIYLQSIVSSFENPLTTMKTNIIGSINILESFRK